MIQGILESLFDCVDPAILDLSESDVRGCKGVISGIWGKSSIGMKEFGSDLDFSRLAVRGTRFCRLI